MTWVLDLVRMLLSVFDRIVYGLIDFFYSTFMLISKVRIFSENTLSVFANRLYVFLALIMLLKLSFSIINYIINPDNFTNNEKGISKLIQNVLLVLVLLVAVPFIFEQAYNVQKIVLEENLAGKIILGIENDSDLEDDEVSNAMAFTVLSAFLSPNTVDISALGTDERGYLTCRGNSMSIGSDITINYNDLTANTKEAKFMRCMNELSNQPVTIDGVSGYGIGQAYLYAYRTNNYSILIDLITAKYNENRDVYIFDYKYVICTIAGGFIAWIFFIFCFDIALRSVKLSFMQLISPVAIISVADPKSSKSGMFQKWMKTSLSTYADLFIRLIAIYFAIFTIKAITTHGEVYYAYGDGEPTFIVNVFVIIGVLMFAKQLPKLIQDITGINLSGNFTLNPIRKFEEGAIGGRRITSAVSGLIAGGVAGAAGAHGIGRVGRALTGGLGGVARGFVGNQGIRGTRDNLVARRHAMEIARENGSTRGARNIVRAQTAFGLDTDVDRINRDERRIAEQESNLNDLINENAEEIARINEQQAADRQRMQQLENLASKNKAMEERAESKITSGEAGDLSKEYFRRQEAVTNLRHQMEIAQQMGNESAVQQISRMIASAETGNREWLTKTGIYQYIDEYSDVAMDGLKADYNEMCRILGETAATTASEMHAQAGTFKGSAGDIQRGFMVGDQEKIALENARKELEEDKRALSEQRRNLEREKSVAQSNIDAVRRAGGGGGNH